MDLPLVSVVITTYYRTEELERAIKHVRAQTFDNLEVIVVDDSGEGYAEPIVAKYNDIIYIPHETNRGAFEARETGFAAASGDFVQFHDDDDWLEPEKIELQVSHFEDKGRVGVVYCGLEEDTGAIHMPDPAKRGDVLKDALRLYELYPYQTTTSLFRAAILDAVFPVPDYGGGWDYVMAIEFGRHSEFDFVDEVLVHRPVSKESKGGSLATRKAHLDIVMNYQDLYENYPDLRHETFADVYWHLGHAYLYENWWSADAIVSFLKSNYHVKSFNPKYAFPLPFSLFGRVGISVGRFLMKSLSRLQTSSHSLR